MKKQNLLYLAFLLLLCSCGHKQPTVVEEMAQICDTLIDRGLYYVCYAPVDSQSKLLYTNYYDSIKEEYDYRKDANGNFFSRKLLSNNIQDDEYKGFFLDERQWYDNHEYDYENDYDISWQTFDELYESIVDINNTPIINDLTDYFQHMPEGVFYPIHSDGGDLSFNVDSIDRPYFEAQLSLLQDYIDNKREDFPKEIVDYARHTAWQKSALYNHTSDIIEIYYSYIFQYRLMQQIACHSPNIELIVGDKNVSDDKMVGFAKLGYNDASGYTYILLKQNSGIYTVDVLPSAYQYLEQSTDESGHTIYSFPYGLSSIINYFFDGNKWHKTEI